MDPASRAIRSLMERPAAYLRELASTAGSLGNERLQPDMERAQGLCLPPLLPDQRLPIESQAGESGTGSSLPLLAEPGVLSVVTRDGVRNSAGVQSPTTPISFPSGRASSAMPDEVIPADRLEIIRGRLRKQVIPERVIPLVLSGPRPTTLAAYQSAWIHWENWCVKFGHSPELNNIGNILLFLTKVLEGGKHNMTALCT
ncbi:hypothetical protein OUZ56_003632 [Daphnia magna]|uniref:Core-binding (CB) domain-containing protein n=1 Tax=Daphnia magna TaxID=35525 RepID=A0ABR0A9A0_9CRUS|nr:hypothetical protein OUZ56_003632 [Daphnia magna]